MMGALGRSPTATTIAHDNVAACVGHGGGCGAVSRNLKIPRDMINPARERRIDRPFFHSNALLCAAVMRFFSVSVSPARTLSSVFLWSVPRLASIPFCPGGSRPALGQGGRTRCPWRIGTSLKKPDDSREAAAAATVLDHEWDWERDKKTQELAIYSCWIVSNRWVLSLGIRGKNSPPARIPEAIPDESPRRFYFTFLLLFLV